MVVKLSKELNEQFASFLEANPSQEFSASLRNLLLEYLQQNIDGGCPVDFGNFLHLLNEFFQLLDLASEELQQPAAKAGTK